MLSLSDLNYAGRLLRKSPWFSLTTMLVLAGGLALSIYTWSVLNTMIYKALPMPDGGSVVRVIGSRDGRTQPINAFALAKLRQGADRLQGMGAYTVASVRMGQRDAARNVDATLAQWSIFGFSRVKPLLGRGFVRADAEVGAPPVVVLGFSVWQTDFVGDPDIIGKMVDINRTPTRVIGVMPRGYAFPVAATVWLPLSTRDLDPIGWSDRSYNVWARLRPGITMSAADAQLQTLLDGVQRQFPRSVDRGDSLQRVSVATFQMAQMDFQGTAIFLVLNVVVLFVLLLACVNVGNMLLARMNQRGREIALRVALGAPSRRLLAQMTLESVLICLGGGGLALVLAGWALHATNGVMAVIFGASHLPWWWQWGLDGQTIVAASAFVGSTILLVAVLPAYRALRAQPASLLRDGSPGASGRHTGSLSRVLVTVEIVLIAVIMAVGGALALVAWRAAHMQTGMDTTNLVRMPLEPRGEAYSTTPAQLRFYQRLLTALDEQPAVTQATITGSLGKVDLAVDDVAYARAEDHPQAYGIVLSSAPDPAGIRRLSGRLFDNRDGSSGAPTALISEALARTLWPHASALGRSIRLVDNGVPGVRRTVVGVVANVRYGEDILTTDRSTYAAVYVPLDQVVVAGAYVKVRYRGNLADARRAIWHALAQVDAAMVPGEITSYAEVLRKLTLMASTMTNLFVLCGLFAILLALTGIYALSSHAVGQRTHEIGLRRALGATDGNIMRQFLRQGCRQLRIGLAVSVLLAAGVLYLLGRFAGVGLGSLVGLGATVTAIVSALVLLAIFMATRRALRGEPADALRHE